MSLLDEDHPRVCGEQLDHNKIKSPVLGSPPRVRGTVKSLRHPFGAFRITPACAGNSGRWPFPANW